MDDERCQNVVCLLYCFYIGEKMMVYNKSIYSNPPLPDVCPVDSGLEEAVSILFLS